MAGRFNPMTVNGHNGYEVVSALQKAIRRGEIDNAVYWAADLDLSGFSQWLWNRILLITSEDVGPAWPEGPATIRALYENWKEIKGKPNNAGHLYIVDAVVRLCRAPKTRVNDHILFVHYVCHENLKREIPDEALDMHTQRGRKMGRGIDHFLEEGAKVYPMADDPDLAEYEDLERKMFAANMIDEPERSARRGEPEEAAPPMDQMALLEDETTDD